MSLPVRGAWIEMEWQALDAAAGRSPCGERGLKLLAALAAAGRSGRSPCGERGLKWGVLSPPPCRSRVAPRAGSVD